MTREILDIHYAEKGVLGTLERLSDGTMSFQYNEQWIEEKGPPISVTLPVKTEAYDHNACWAFFHSLVVEGSMRERLALFQKFTVDDDYAFLATYGGECAGALVFRPHGDSRIKRPQYKKMSDEELQTWMDKPNMHPPLLASAEEGMRISLGGVQDKLYR